MEFAQLVIIGLNIEINGHPTRHSVTALFTTSSKRRPSLDLDRFGLSATRQKFASTWVFEVTTYHPMLTGIHNNNSSSRYAILRIMTT